MLIAVFLRSKRIWRGRIIWSMGMTTYLNNASKQRSPKEGVVHYDFVYFLVSVQNTRQ